MGIYRQVWVFIESIGCYGQIWVFMASITVIS